MMPTRQEALERAEYFMGRPLTAEEETVVRAATRDHADRELGRLFARAFTPIPVRQREVPA